MKTKKKLLIIIAIAVVVIIIGGVSIYATTNHGSESDPLVTKSYITGIVEQSIKSDAEEMLDEKSDELEDALSDMIADYESDINDAIANSGADSEIDTFSVLTITTDDVVVCGVGTEIMLRIGSAEAYGEDYPAIVDTTSTESLYSGEDLETNHMYMVTIRDCGIRATSGTTKVLIRGEYTVE